MKTQDQAGRQDYQRSAQQTRRLRTMAAVECESLEGRKLMTGFGGAASSLMGHGPADLARMDRGGMDQAGDFQNSTDPGGWGMGVGAIRSHSQSPRATNDFGGRFDPAAMGLGMTGAGQGDSFGPGFRSDMTGNSPGRWDQSNGPMMASVGSGATSSTSAPTTQLGTDLTKLRTDEQAIHDKSQVTPALLAAVRKDLAAIDEAKTGTADATALKTLQTDEQTIFASKTAPTDAQQTQLQTDRDAVLKSQGVSQTLIDQLATDQLAVKTASNFTAADQATLDADQAAITKDRAATPAPGSDSASGAQANSAPSTPPTTAPAAATPAAADSTSTALAAPAPAGSTVATTADPASPVTPAAAPAASTTPTATPAVAAATDPALTQTTSTAASMTIPGGVHHAQFGALHASAASHAGLGHHIQSTIHRSGEGRRGPRS